MALSDNELDQPAWGNNHTQQPPQARPHYSADGMCTSEQEEVPSDYSRGTPSGESGLVA